MRRSAVLLLVVSCALAGAFGSLSAAGAAADPLSDVTVSADIAAKPTVEFDKPFAVKKTANKVVAAGTGDTLAEGSDDPVRLRPRRRSHRQGAADLVRSGPRVAGPRQEADRDAARAGPDRRDRRQPACSWPSRRKDGLAKRITTKGVKKSDTLLFVIDVKSRAHSAGEGDRRSGAARRRPADGDGGGRAASRPSRSRRRRRPDHARVAGAGEGHRPGGHHRPDRHRPLHRRDLGHRQEVRLVVGPRHALRLRDRHRRA